MSWGAIVGVGLGMLQSYSASKAYTKQIGYESAAKLEGIKATTEAYKADVDAYVLQNFINEEMAKNAIVEAERAGGANLREAQVQVKQGASKIAAQSEGITAGASKARELSSFYTQASKAIGKEQEQTTKQIIQIADTLDKATNDIQAKAEKSYQQMLLSLSGVSSYSSISLPAASDSIVNVLQGAQMGMSFEKNIGDLTATNTTTG